MSMRQTCGIPLVGLLMTLGLSVNVGAAEIIGNLATDQAVTVTGQGLEVKVRPGQDYVVFSGDDIQSGAGEGLSVLTIPETGIIKLSPDSAASVERSDGRYLLTVARGEVGFEVVPGAKVFLVNGDELIDLGQGTGKGGVAVSADGADGYLVLVDASGDIKIIHLQTSALVYEGPPNADLIKAQYGAAGGAGAGAAGGAASFGAAGAGVSGAGILGLGAATLPLAALAATVAAVAVAETRRGTGDDVDPASPVTPVPL